MDYINKNGFSYPLIGFGTFDLPNNKFTEIIGTAYKLGYRLFDTAHNYGNESWIASAIRDNSIPRKDILLQTKIDIEQFYHNGFRYGRKRILNIPNFHSVRRELEGTLERLNTDYIDVMLIHWPYPGFAKIYKKLIELKNEGLIRLVGVSSFLPPHIEYLDSLDLETPVINQFEISPLNFNKRLIEYYKKRGIIIQAMSTFSHFKMSAPRSEILDNDIIIRIANKYRKTVPQIVYRWLIQQNITIIPKSKNPLHIEENISIFDFTLDDEDIQAITALDRGKFLNYDPTKAFYSVPKNYRNSEWFKH